MTDNLISSRIHEIPIFILKNLDFIFFTKSDEDPACSGISSVPIESVSKMLGHSDIRTTHIYAKVMDIKVGNDMELLRQKLMVK